MKLNETLINVIMIYLEEKLEYDKTLQLAAIAKDIPEFIKEKGYTFSEPSALEINYALKKIIDFNFVECDVNKNAFLLSKICDITIFGFKYLDNPRLF